MKVSEFIMMIKGPLVISVDGGPAVLRQDALKTCWSQGVYDSEIACVSMDAAGGRVICEISTEFEDEYPDD